MKKRNAPWTSANQGVCLLCVGLRKDPQNKTERNKAAAEEQRPDYEKYTGRVDGTPVGQPVGSKVTLALAPRALVLIMEVV